MITPPVDDGWFMWGLKSRRSPVSMWVARAPSAAAQMGRSLSGRSRVRCALLGWDTTCSPFGSVGPVCGGQEDVGVEEQPLSHDWCPGPVPHARRSALPSQGCQQHSSRLRRCHAASPSPPPSPATERVLEPPPLPASDEHLAAATLSRSPRGAAATIGCCDAPGMPERPVATDWPGAAQRRHQHRAREEDEAQPQLLDDTVPSILNFRPTSATIQPVIVIPTLAPNSTRGAGAHCQQTGIDECLCQPR